MLKIMVAHGHVEMEVKLLVNCGGTWTCRDRGEMDIKMLENYGGTWTCRHGGKNVQNYGGIWTCTKNVENYSGTWTCDERKNGEKRRCIKQIGFTLPAACTPLEAT